MLYCRSGTLYRAPAICFRWFGRSSWSPNCSDAQNGVASNRVASAIRHSSFARYSLSFVAVVLAIEIVLCSLLRSGYLGRPRAAEAISRARHSQRGRERLDVLSDLALPRSGEAACSSVRRVRQEHHAEDPRRSRP